MKKIISIVALWSLLATWTLWQVNAMSWMNMWEMGWMSWSTMNWDMMNMWEMWWMSWHMMNWWMMNMWEMWWMSWHTMDWWMMNMWEMWWMSWHTMDWWMMNMWEMGWMSWHMMNWDMMKEHKAIMQKISASLDDDWKMKLTEMKNKHMWDMMKFMKDSSHIDNYQAREEMKKAHLSDLKELLKDNPKLYKEVYVEMETMMDKMMNQMHSNGWEMNHMKKRLFSSKVQAEMDKWIEKLFVNLDKLSSEKKNEKIQVILRKIENAKSKSENIKSESKKAKINDILEYIKEEILKKGWSWEIMWEKIEGSMLMNDNNENLLKANKSEVVELKNGDTYTMEVTKVKKEVWNREVVMLAYNWSIPGPVIKVAKNSEITLKFINKVQGLETTLHSHGLRLDNAFDWVPVEMMWKQKIMKYWDTFEYKLKFPDEGIYWYHPHVKEELQQELWLYGNYLVEPTNSNYWSKVNREETLILDDILLDNDKIEAFSDSFTNYTLMWRFWNTMMINWETNYMLNAKKGETIRMYFTNVSNTRPYNIIIPWTKIKLVWWDNGKYEKEEFVDSFVIAPAERYIVEVYFEKDWEYKIQNKTPNKIYDLWKVVVSNEAVKDSYKKEFETLRVNQDVISDIDKYRADFDKPNDKEITLTIWKKWQKWWEMMMWWNNGMMWMWWMNHMNMWWNNDKTWIEWEDTMNQMNKSSNSDLMEWKIIEDSTKKENMDIDWKFKVWDKVKIKIFNDGNSMHPMQHPIHFHWQRFLVISENGKKPNNLVWKDTAMVKTWEYIEILVDMSNPWEWMSHCHIAEHLMSWMMMYFSVEK